MTLELPIDLIEYWGTHKQTPMLLLDFNNIIIWHNKWSAWLFEQPLQEVNIRQLQSGDILEDFISLVRKHQQPPMLSMTMCDVPFQVSGQLIQREDGEVVLLKWHMNFLSTASMLEVYRMMQDFALEAGDRVNNPLTTVLNCLHMLKRSVPESNPNFNFLELALREATTMQEFGNYVRRLSNELPVMDTFDLVATIRDAMDRRGLMDWELAIPEAVPPVIGALEHAKVVLGGFISLVKQATGNSPGRVSIAQTSEGRVSVVIAAGEGRVRDLRMLSEEFYGGLGLMSARYLLTLMQAHLDLDYGDGNAVQIAFVPGATKEL
ncbi:MAG: HAMP domain-containing histidine kinase [Firmicutes bacterium]|nr:HAMP domain-containing histidine kinase [Bacillota bacterium]